MILRSSILFKPWSDWLSINFNLHFIFTLLTAITLPIDVDVQYCSIATGLLLLNWVAGGDFKEKIHQLFHRKIGLLIILFYLLYLTGLLYTQNLTYGFKIAERLLSLLVIPLILLSKPLTLPQRDFVVVSFIIFSVFLALVGVCYGFLHYQEVIQNKGPEHLVTYISNIHRVYFSIYLLFCFLALFYYYRKFRLSTKPLLKWTTIILAGLIALLLLIMASRMIILLLIATTASLIFYFTIVKEKQYIKAMLFSLAGLILMIVVYTQVTYIREFMNQLIEKLDQGQSSQVNSVNIRVIKYKCAVQGIKQNWMWGVGTGDVQDCLNSIYKENEFHEGYTLNMDSHNQYLQTWLSIGLPGLLTLVLLMFVSIWKGIQDRNYLLIYLILIFGICCMSESLLTTQKGIVFLSLFYPLVFINKPTTHSSYNKELYQG